MKGCRALGQVYSHLSEEERRIIRIEIGNGTSIRRIAGLIGRHASTVSRGIKRNTWFPSNENESYRPYRPERLKTGPWTGRCHIAGPAHRKAGRRRARPGVTHDNGAEFARHAELRERLGMAAYFTAPYPSCRRGGNENRNGAIRRYLPEHTRVDPSMADEIQAIVDETDNRPMRVLGYRTPAEAFADELLSLTEQQGCCTSK